jgi:hypothetical protein
MRLRQLGTVVAALTLMACADEGPVSGPGTLTATLISPNGNEGAAVVVLLGDSVGAITPAGATEVFSQEGDSQTRIVLIDQAGGALTFRVAVPDTTVHPAWVIDQVAGPDDKLRTLVDGYALEFRR